MNDTSYFYVSGVYCMCSFAWWGWQHLQKLMGNGAKRYAYIVKKKTFWNALCFHKIPVVSLKKLESSALSDTWENPREDHVPHPLPRMWERARHVLVVVHGNLRSAGCNCGDVSVQVCIHEASPLNEQTVRMGWPLNHQGYPVSNKWPTAYTSKCSVSRA